MNKHFYIIFPFTVWGLTPLFFHFLPTVEPIELLSHRIIWSSVMILGVLKYNGIGWNRLFKNKKDVLVALIVGVFMNASWTGFMYAINTNQLMAASMAFFITPIIVFLFGFLLFREHIEKYQKLALALTFIAVFSYVLIEARMPLLSLFISITFALYIVIKKSYRHNPMGLISLEHFLFVPFAIAYLVFNTAVPDTTASWVALIGAAPLQLIPVFTLAKAVEKFPLNQVSIAQYLEPILHIVLAIFIFREEVSNGQIMATLFVVLAVTIVVLNTVKHAVKPMHSKKEKL